MLHVPLSVVQVWKALFLLENRHQGTFLNPRSDIFKDEMKYLKKNCTKVENCHCPFDGGKC